MTGQQPGETGVDLVICGLGYVGLALAQEASTSGLRVLGYDIDETTVHNLTAGRSHIDDVFDEDLVAMAETGFSATTDPDALGRAPVVMICVPTPLDANGGPDLRAVRDAASAIALRLRPGMLVVLESTSYPGTTEEVVLPILEEGSGLKVGTDFHLAFSPERIDPGNKVYTLAKTPKIVGGCTPMCATRAAEIYGRFTEVVRARGTREAEMAKLLENTYRHVNIGLINEIAMLCHRLSIDVWDVINCAATKPFGFQSFSPGPGVGGHCIPVDPLYLSYRARQFGFSAGLIEAAERVNSAMPHYVVQRCAALLRSRDLAVAGSRVLLLGVTYKADIADLRMTPAYEIARDLLTAGASVSYHDPYVENWTVEGIAVPRSTDLATALPAANLTVLLQKHAVYEPEVLAGSAQLIFDARGMLADRRGEHIEVL